MVLADNWITMVWSTWHSIPYQTGKSLADNPVGSSITGLATLYMMLFMINHGFSG